MHIAVALARSGAEIFERGNALFQLCLITETGQPDAVFTYFTLQ